MGVIDELIGAIQRGPGDDSKKAMVEVFLRGAAPVVEELGVDGVWEVMEAAAEGRGVGMVEDADGELNERQVVELLRGTGQEMSEAADRAERARAARKAAVEGLKEAAFTVMARALLGML